MKKTTVWYAAALSALFSLPAVAGDTVYTYDVHGQVIGVTRSVGATTYTYDLAGNRTQVTGPGGAGLMAAPPPAPFSSAVDDELVQDVARAQAQQAALKKLAPIPAPAARSTYTPLPGVAAAIAKASKDAPDSKEP